MAGGKAHELWLQPHAMQRPRQDRGIETGHVDMVFVLEISQWQQFDAEPARDQVIGTETGDLAGLPFGRGIGDQNGHGGTLRVMNNQKDSTA